MRWSRIMFHIFLHEYNCLSTIYYVGFPGGSAGKKSTCSVGELGSIRGLGWSPGERISYPLLYSGLENPIDCIIHDITKSHTHPNAFHFHLFPIINSNKFHLPWPVVLPLSNIKYFYVVNMILGSLVVPLAVSFHTNIKLPYLLYCHPPKSLISSKQIFPTCSSLGWVWPIAGCIHLDSACQITCKALRGSWFQWHWVSKWIGLDSV